MKFIEERKSLFRVALASLGLRKKTSEDLHDLLDIGLSVGVIEARSVPMMEGVVQVGETRVRDIMIPRSQMIVLNQDISLEEALDTVVRHGHSRYPVLGEESDKVVGVLLAKDLLGYWKNGSSEKGNQFEIQGIVRQTVWVPESKRLSILLEEFKKTRNHLAVVVDEYGGIAGLITIEDVVEQIVGDIEDEHDAEASENIRCHEDAWLINGMTPLDEFNDRFSTNLKGSGTLAGFIIRQLG